jgi:signal transduction histidine kinase
MGYVQGLARESQLSPEDFALMQAKLERVAGLYVYRDGLRVLPYGTPDFDWLNIEERRTRRVSTYFFSYRRMFGAVELSSRDNSQLQEKAGREGFRDNVALRQLRDILTNFLVQLAADFFREGGTYAEDFVERRLELSKTEKIRQDRARRTRGKREAFRRQVEATLDAFDRGDPLRELGEVEQSYRHNLQGAELDLGMDLVTALVKAEEGARQAVAGIRQRYAVARPRGIGLSRALNRDWTTYTRIYDGFVAKDVARVEESLPRELDHAAARLGVEREVRLQLNASVTAALSEARSRLWGETRSLRQELDQTSQRVLRLTKEVQRSVDTTVREVETELASADFAALSDDAAAARRQELERQLLDELDEQSNRLSALHGALTSVGRMATAPAADEELEALEEEVLALREQAELDLELAQLGMAVQVVNHEFSSSMANVRRNLRLLRPWADINPELTSIQQELAGAFEHLESYLSLLTPLQRRLYRHPVDITGQAISDFLLGLFGERLRRHHIKLVTKNRFAKHKIHGYPSTYYPVFVNLVDNAIFWLQDQPEPRRIELDVHGPAMTVTDTGSGVSTRDREAIFESGFSRKPGGRGLGLKISRDVLRRNDWDLVLDDPAPGRGARFLIAPRLVHEPAGADEMNSIEDGDT